MAEDSTFSAFSNGSAADALAKTVAKIKSDMAAIEASAKSITDDLTKASRLSIGGGSQFGARNAGGGTGFSKSAGGTSALGTITSQLGGVRGVGTFAAAAMGGVAGAVSGKGAAAGAIALAGLPDLMLTPERALNYENARFGVQSATGDFGTFSRMMGTAKNDFNVQNQQDFMNTMVYGTQRMGLIGLNGGGTTGEKAAAAQIGGYNTLAGMAGIDQSAVPGIMQNMNSAQNFYASMATGTMTRDPVTGKPISMEGQVNQAYNNQGYSRMSKEKALDQIDINFGEGGTGLQQLREQGMSEDAIATYVTAMRTRAQTGEALKTNQVQDQAKAAGILGTDKTQGNEATRGLESSQMGLTGAYADSANKGVAAAANSISDAVDLLTNLSPPLKGLVEDFQTAKTAMDVFNTELPGATKGITSFFSGLPGLITGLLLGGGKGSLLGGAARLAGGALLTGGEAVLGTALGAAGAVAVGAGAAVAGVGLAGKWAVNHFTDYDEHKGAKANAGTAQTAGTTSNATAPTSGYGGHAKGDWFVEADQDTRIHYGEMILPNRVATAVRKELDVAKTDQPSGNGGGGKGGATVNIYLTVQKASDQEAVAFANKVKRVIEDDRELYAVGAGRLSRG